MSNIDVNVKKRHRSDDGNSYDCLHDKNPYKNNPPNVHDLSLKYKTLQKYVKNQKMNWADGGASQVLTDVLLQHNFHFNFQFLDNHLCPPLPSRINYLCWLSDLFDGKEIKNSTRIVCDIGVGPICIYPVLGQSLFSWKFVGSDIDECSVLHAKQNLNKYVELRDNISIVHVLRSDNSQQIVLNWISDHINDDCNGNCGLLQSLLESVEGSLVYQRGPVAHTFWSLGGEYRLRLEACESHLIDKGTMNPNFVSETQQLLSALMTNPPFYGLEEEINSNVFGQMCPGTLTEMRTLGGEVAFVASIIADSLLLRHSVQWYSSMLGKKSSLKILLKILALEGIPRSQVVTTEFQQGKTHRWGLAWTFSAASSAAYRLFLQQKRCAQQSGEQGRAYGFSVSSSLSALRSTSTEQELENIPLSDGLATCLSLVHRRLQTCIQEHNNSRNTQSGSSSRCAFTLSLQPLSASETSACIMNLLLRSSADQTSLSRKECLQLRIACQEKTQNFNTILENELTVVNESDMLVNVQVELIPRHESAAANGGSSVDPIEASSAHDMVVSFAELDCFKVSFVSNFQRSNRRWRRELSSKRTMKSVAK